MRSPFRARAVLTVFLLVVLVACAGAFAAWRVLQSRVGPSPPAWSPPVPASASVSTSPSIPDSAASATPTAPVPATTLDVTPSPVRPEDLLPSPPLTPTEGVPTETPSSPSAGSYRFLPIGRVRHAASGCPGQYIMGIVQDGQGNALSDVRLRSSDQWGNESVTYTKAGTPDVGRYDFPLFPPEGAAMTYAIVVVDAEGDPVSPAVSVPHRHDGPDREANCHWVDWQEVE